MMVLPLYSVTEQCFNDLYISKSALIIQVIYDLNVTSSHSTEKHNDPSTGERSINLPPRGTGVAMRLF